MSTIHDEIRSRTDAFATEIAALVRRAALEAVTSALGPAAVAPAAKPAPAKAPAPVKKAAPAKAAPAKKAAPVAAKPTKAAPAAKAAPAKKPAGGKPAPAKRPPGAKRPPAELAALVERLGSYIQQNPGLGVEVIGKALATPTSDLTLPIKKLLAGKRIRFEGVKRATKYFPA